MKAVFKKTALDRVMEIHHDALYKNKKIDYILVTPEEYDEIRHTCGSGVLDYGYHYYNMKTDSYTTSFETVELKRKHTTCHSQSPYARFMFQPTTILGHRIVVAPAEFH
jgi:hypothetical protein